MMLFALPFSSRYMLLKDQRSREVVIALVTSWGAPLAHSVQLAAQLTQARRTLRRRPALPGVLEPSVVAALLLQRRGTARCGAWPMTYVNSDGQDAP
eukprot:CAMPEP_0202096532 /NCGR_PEP_ID=MMETSP0965-20130614/679_1 /ASSEMBLY_ACC=CAM_ASM_000507 /TAXON_ID=4773 /ORGANISM="Schizochytrium aggregatum, Strain ATCC28209" /LENGTH=96 /DNA_ID=CAMNT_0048664873 /DNA_START=338 /DNA_END=625 /DNA_ORIENTATION=-